MSADDNDELPDGFDFGGEFGDDLGDLGGDMGDFEEAPPPVEQNAKGVTRFQMIEYLSQREWQGPEFQRGALKNW